MIDITLENFETEVIAASMHTPVLVDFWATWCGPCQTLGPVLEQLEDQYQGRFRLAKVDADQQQQLAAAFGIRSIPTCILVKNGQPVDGFTGALPAGQVRQFLDKHVPSAGALAAQEEVDEADALAQDPANDTARADYAYLLIASGQLNEAETVLQEPLARQPRPLRFDALARWLHAARTVQAQELGQWSLPALDEAIAQNKRDFAARLQKAQILMADRLWTQAMDELLEIIMRERAWQDDEARKTYVAILELLTPAPEKSRAPDAATAGGIALTGKAAAARQDPQVELVSAYRRKLSMALN